MEISFFITIFTCLVTVLCFRDRTLFEKLQFNAYDVRHSGQWYRFFSYGFLHADWVHLFVNMFVLLSFGASVERRYHQFFHDEYVVYYILLYVGGLLLSILPAYGKHKNDVLYNSVGASGAVSAIVFAGIIITPLAKIRFIFFPVGIPAWMFGLLYLAYEFYMQKKGRDNIGHDAHFWGAIFGLVYTLALRPSIGQGFLRMLGLIS
jgi:membrane associated rhomboid family serine protease